MQRILRRENSSANHDLDKRRTVGKVLARSAKHCILAINDKGHTQLANFGLASTLQRAIADRFVDSLPVVVDLHEREQA